MAARGRDDARHRAPHRAALPHRRPAQPVQLPLPRADRARGGARCARAWTWMLVGLSFVGLRRCSSRARAAAARDPDDDSRRARPGHVGRARRRRRRSSSTSCSGSRGALAERERELDRGARAGGAPGAARVARDDGGRRGARAVDAARHGRARREGARARARAERRTDARGRRAADPRAGRPLPRDPRADGAGRGHRRRERRRVRGRASCSTRRWSASADAAASIREVDGRGRATGAAPAAARASARRCARSSPTRRTRSPADRGRCVVGVRRDRATCSRIAVRDRGAGMPPRGDGAHRRAVLHDQGAAGAAWGSGCSWRAPSSRASAAACEIDSAGWRTEDVGHAAVPTADRAAGRMAHAAQQAWRGPAARRWYPSPHDASRRRRSRRS